MHEFDAGHNGLHGSEGFEAEHWPGDALNGSVFFLDDIVFKSQLPHCISQTDLDVNIDDRGRVGVALVDDNFLGHLVQADSVSKHTRAVA